MVSGNWLFERKLIEQSGLLDMPMSHHDSKSCLLQQLNHRTSYLATEDFFNKISRFRMLTPVEPQANH